MDPRTVLIDADVLGRQRTGDETYVANLLRELGTLEGDTGDIDIAAVARDPSRIPPGIRAIALPARNQLLRTFWRLPGLVRRLDPALAHFQYIVPPGVGVRAVVTVHDISFEWFPRLFAPHDLLAFRALVPRSARRAAVVLTVSEWLKGEIVERYRIPETRIVVTYNGVDPVFRPDGPRFSGPPYVLFVGNIRPIKDPETAIEAIRLLDEELRLVIVGPDNLRAERVRRLVVERGIERRVEFRGHVDRKNLAPLYRGAECLVVPSRSESFGLPMVEAMACGTPVVATAVAAIPEVAGGAAVLVPPADPAALADGVRRAIADRDPLREAGLRRAASFSWRETARRTLAAYRDAMR